MREITKTYILSIFLFVFLVFYMSLRLQILDSSVVECICKVDDWKTPVESQSSR